MRAQMPLALFALVLGTLEVAGGAQEMIYLGIMNSETYPLVAGALGVLTGGLLLAAGITLLIRFPARCRSCTGHRLDFSARFYPDGHRHAPGGLADHRVEDVRGSLVLPRALRG